MKVEDEKPTITYEAFVEDLDEGDSFTASLVDVLVKVRQFRVLTPIYCRSHFSRSWQSAGHGQTPETVASSLNGPRSHCECKQLQYMSTLVVGTVGLGPDILSPTL